MSESYQELTKGLQFVFDAIKSGDIRPQIHIRTVTEVNIEEKDF